MTQIQKQKLEPTKTYGELKAELRAVREASLRATRKGDFMLRARLDVRAQGINAALRQLENAMP